MIEEDKKQPKKVKIAAQGRHVPYKAVTPPFGYFGSKHRLAPKIVEMLPPHNAWVDIFCGSASVTLAKPPAPIEVINDLDGDVANLFKQLRDNFDALYRAIELTPYSRSEFELARLKESGHSNLERARRFLIAMMMTVNGSAGSVHAGFSFSDSFCRGGREARVNRWYQLPERLSEVVERLRSVRIENLDARVLLKKYLDRPATLVYLDPPYFMDRNHGYAIDANDAKFHTELLELCGRARCMILISGYECSLYTELLKAKEGWVQSAIEATTRDTTGNTFGRTEMLWMNKAFVAAKKTAQVPITLSDDELRENKINPIRT